MKILLTMNLPYLRAYGGANRSNRSLVEELAARGHLVRVVVPALATPSRATLNDYLESLDKSGVDRRTSNGCDSFHLNGVEVVSVHVASRLRATVIEHIDLFQPDWVLVSSEDQSQNLLAGALERCPSRVIFLAHTPQMLPFGPESLYPGQARTDLIRRVAGIVAISNFVAEYVEQGIGRKVFINHPPHYGPGPFPDLGSRASGSVLLLNPCAVKGLPIFLGLAKMFPQFPFTAVPGYGTTDADRVALARHPNVTLLTNAANLDEILSQARVVLMPSLWAEGFGMAAVDAMLRGIPVLASDFGGLREAALGTATLIPVNPIVSYNLELDAAMLPEPVIPEQDLAPWAAGLEPLMLDRDLYRARSTEARDCALRFVNRLSCAPLEQFLAELVTEPRPVAPVVRLAAEDAAELRMRQFTPDQRALLMLRLKKKLKNQAAAGMPLRAYPRDVEIPLSFAQRRLWIVERLAPGTTVNNITIAFKLIGALDRRALRSAMREIVRRHEILRTCFPVEENEPRQLICTSPFAIREITLETTSRESSQREIAEACRIEAANSFDLANGPLISATLARVRDEEHVLILAMHHIVSDGWSMNVMLSEFAQLYQAHKKGSPSPLAELEIQYADYTLWQRERISGGLLAKQINYWKQKLSGLTPLELPADHPRPLVPSQRGDYVPFFIPEALSRRLKNFAASEGATLFMVLLGAFKILLSRYAGTADVTLGTVTANRPEMKLEPLIGFFVNSLVLRTDLSGPCTFRELTGRIKLTVLEAQQNQDVPFELLLDELAPRRDLSRAPLFQVMFVLQNIAPAQCSLEDLEIIPLESEDDSAKFDLTVALSETPDGITGTISFSTDLFDRVSIVRMANHLQIILAAVVATPDADIARLSLIDHDERLTLVEEWAGKQQSIAERTIVDLVVTQSRKTPQAIAVVCGPAALSYEDLDRQTNQLARVLRELAVGPEIRVGVCLGRSERIIVAILAILKAGGVYVPLDPNYPEERLSYMLGDAAPRVLITESALGSRFQGIDLVRLEFDSQSEYVRSFNAEPLQSLANESNAAYMLYTSGSTGLPKSAVIENHSTVALVEWALRTYSAAELSTVLFASSVSFDASILEIFPALACGGKVVVVPNLLEWSGEEESGDEERDGGDASFIFAVPSVMAEWSKTPGVKTLPGVVTLGGEPVPKWLLDRLVESDENIRVINVYGPTECTTCATFSELQPEKIPTIGKPLLNTKVYVLDSWQELVPIGVAGELYIAGAGVGRGYWKQPAMTADRFLPNPFNGRGERMYRTGDWVRWRDDGNLEFMGRIDQQVKINGCRIELGEIESALCGHPQVAQAAVAVREDNLGAKCLVAYWTPRETAGPMPAHALRDFLQTRLPAHMLPSAFVPVADLPRSANGKLERSALPKPEEDAQPLDARPADIWEERLMEIWSNVLGGSTIGLRQDFFLAGGNSLKAIVLATRIAKEFDRKTLVRFVFEHPTIKRQAVFLRDGFRVEAPPSIVPIRQSGRRRPLFCVHPQFGFAHGYLGLASLLGTDLPLYGLQSQGIEEGQTLIATIPEMASFYLDSVRSIQPHGPYRLLGWSMGSPIVYEMACQLYDAGEEVSFLGLLDGRPTLTDGLPRYLRLLNRESLIDRLSEQYLNTLATQSGLAENTVKALPMRERAELYLRTGHGGSTLPGALLRDQFERILRVIASNHLALTCYKPVPHPLAAFLLRVPIGNLESSTYGWDRLALGGVEVHEIPGNHDDLLSPPVVSLVAATLRPLLDASESASARNLSTPILARAGA